MDGAPRRNLPTREIPITANFTESPSAIASFAKTGFFGSESASVPSTEAAELNVRTLTLSDHGSAATTLANVLKNNPIVRYLIDADDCEDKSAAEKDEVLATSMQYILHAIIAVGNATTIGPNCDSVALW